MRKTKYILSKYSENFSKRKRILKNISNKPTDIENYSYRNTDQSSDAFDTMKGYSNIDICFYIKKNPNNGKILITYNSKYQDYIIYTNDEFFETEYDVFDCLRSRISFTQSYSQMYKRIYYRILSYKKNTLKNIKRHIKDCMADLVKM